MRLKNPTPEARDLNRNADDVLQIIVSISRFRARRGRHPDAPNSEYADWWDEFADEANQYLSLLKERGSMIVPSHVLGMFDPSFDLLESEWILTQDSPLALPA